MTATIKSDDLSNLDLVERFPFSICHRPICNLVREMEAGGRVQRLPSQESLREICSQPIALESPQRTEYVLEAVRPE